MKKLKMKNVKMLRQDVKAWYLEEYEDDYAERLPDGVEFYDYVIALNKREDVSNLMGEAADSIIRERIFGRIAYVLEIDYADIYEIWLDSEAV